MAIFHKGFSGRWSSDYQLIPSLVDPIIKSQYPEELKKSQKAFKQAFIDNQKNHYSNVNPSVFGILKKWDYKKL